MHQPSLPSKCPDWLGVTEGRAGSRPAAAASLWGALRRHTRASAALFTLSGERVRARALFSARTVDGDEGVEVLHGQQRVRQLPDEELQQGCRVVLLELVPREHAIVEGRLQLLAQRLGWENGGRGVI